MKAIPHFLVAGVLVFGTACSTTNTGAGAAGTATTTPTGGDTNAASNTTGSTAGTGSTASAGADTSTGSSGATSGTAGAAGGAPGTDMTAFVGTFATMPDPVFLMTAASSNLLEIQTGQKAAQQATSAEVKKFAQMMVSHHTKATQQLQAVATPLGVEIPQTMMPIHQALADRLQNKTARKFDEAYMDLMETAHKMDIAMFEVKSKGAQNPAVQTFATTTLPMLRSHHDMANAIEKKVD